MLLSSLLAGVHICSSGYLTGMLDSRQRLITAHILRLITASIKNHRDNKDMGALEIGKNNGWFLTKNDSFGVPCSSRNHHMKYVIQQTHQLPVSAMPCRHGDCWAMTRALTGCHVPKRGIPKGFT